MLGREPYETRFQGGTEIRGFDQIKNFLRHITPQNKFYCFSEKRLGLGALNINKRAVFDIGFFKLRDITATLKLPPAKTLCSVIVLSKRQILLCPNLFSCNI